jgi:hypothetical protein
VNVTHARRRAGSGRLAVLLLAIVGATAALVTACSSSSASSAASRTLFGTAKHQQCTSVADVLSDGPDPDADPVGYAQAQVLPLRQLKLSDPALRREVTRLAAAYQAYSTSKGAAGKTAAQQVKKAEAAVNAICPGAAH